MSKQSDCWKKIAINNLSVNHLLIILGICAGILIGYGLLADTSIDAVENPDLVALYDEIKSDRSSRKKIEKWLEKNWMLYRIDDSALAGAIENLCPAFFENNFNRYQESLERCIHENLAKRSEKYPISRVPSFLDLMQPIRVSVPPKKYQPADNIAYTCFGGKFAGSLIRLHDHNLQEYLQLDVVGGYTCLEGHTYPDLQLNERQAWKLFNRKVLQTDYAAALIL